MAAAALVALGGCYERTVESHGLGSAQGPVEPVYRSETFLDHAFDSLVGDQPAPDRGTYRPMPNSKVPTMSTGERRPQ